MKGGNMKFLYTCILSISLALFAQQNALGAETFKIGILDFQKCFDESNEGRRIFGDLRKKQEALQGKHETENRWQEEKNLVRSKIDRLLTKLDTVAED